MLAIIAFLHDRSHACRSVNPKNSLPTRYNRHKIILVSITRKSMKHQVLAHPSAIDHQAYSTEIMPGVQRFVNTWLPLRISPWASLTIFHGFGDHGGRFDSIAVSLASSGVGVLAVDLIGHGRSPGRRGVIPSYNSMMDEVGNATNLASRMWEETPAFVLGHSMGGNLVLNWAIRRRFEAKSLLGLIAVAPMLRLAKKPSLQFLKVGRWLEQRWPNFRLSAPVDVRQLCSDPSGQDAYRRDPLIHRKLTLRLGNALIENGEWAMENAAQLTKPCLLMHGADDTLTCPKATEEFADRVGESATLKLWPNCRHDLHFELQRESVVTFLLSWLRQKSGVSKTCESRMTHQIAA